MKAMKTESLKDTDFIFLKVKNLWTHFKTESLAFKCITMYLFIEMFRPQSIFTFLDFAPWAQIFLILSLVGAFSDKHARFRFTGMHGLMVAFFVTINLSIVTAYDYNWSLRYYINFFQWIIIFFLITAIVTTKERFYIFFLTFFMCALKVAIGTSKNWAMRGFGFTSWGLKGPPGFFENSGELAVLMLVLFPLSFYLYKTYKDDVTKIERYLLLIAVICPVLTILGSSSRGAQLALLVQLLCMFWRQIFKPKSLIIIALVGSIGWQVLPQEQKDRFTEIGNDKSSMQRELYWEHGWDMMKEHPLLGVGYFNFRPYYQDHYPEDVLYKYAELPHNIFIQIGTDAGFAGLLIYVSIIVGSFFKKHPNPHKKGQKVDLSALHPIWPSLKFGTLGFVIAGQFVTIGYYPFLWLIVALQVAYMNTPTIGNKVNE